MILTATTYGDYYGRDFPCHPAGGVICFGRPCADHFCFVDDIRTGFMDYE